MEALLPQRSADFSDGCGVTETMSIFGCAWLWRKRVLTVVTARRLWLMLQHRCVRSTLLLRYRQRCTRRRIDGEPFLQVTAKFVEVVESFPQELCLLMRVLAAWRRTLVRMMSASL